MKIFVTLPFLAAFSTFASAAAISESQNQQAVMGPSLVAGTEELFIIEVAPGVTKLVSEDEKWALRRVRATCDRVVPRR